MISNPEQIDQSLATRSERGLGFATERSHEIASAAAAMKSRAMVEAKFVIALQRPRNVLQARAEILEACKRPRFAELARYRKPVGGSEIVGPSIRFAEEAIRAMRNIDVSATVLFEDAEKRILHVSVTDLESNTSYGEDITITKSVERLRPTRDRRVIAERTNSRGETVYILEATDDEIANKVAAAKSKVIRNSGLRLVPQDIIEEAMSIVDQTLSNGGADPKAETKRICDAFAAIGISPSELEKYLGHSIATITPKELSNLRAVYAAIKDGEANWGDYVQDASQNVSEPGTKPKPTLRRTNASETQEKGTNQ